MQWKNLQWVLGLGLGDFALRFRSGDRHRNILPEQHATGSPIARDKGPKNQEAPGLSIPNQARPPAASVVPTPNEAPFKGTIGRTVGESTPAWTPQAVAPKDAPNVSFTLVLDDVGFAALECYRLARLQNAQLG